MGKFLYGPTESSVVAGRVETGGTDWRERNWVSPVSHLAESSPYLQRGKMKTNTGVIKRVGLRS